MKIRIFFLIAVFIFLCHGVSAQMIERKDKNNKPQAKLLDYFGNLNSEERSARIDIFLGEIAENENSKGEIIIYCGKVCQYGELEAHIRGINHKLGLRGAKEGYRVVIGGYRQETSVELWIIPQDACPPIPKSDFKIEDIKFNGTFKRKIVYYECCFQ